MSNTTTTKRPHELSPRVLELLRPKIIERLTEWADDADEAEEFADHLLDSCCLSDNGYELAKSLEDAFAIDPDRELVETLDDVWSDRREAVDQATKEWVAANEIKVPFAVGDAVELKDKPLTRHQWVGEVVSIDHTHAKCTVRIASKGHVKEGELGSLGEIHPAEDLQIAQVVG